MTHKEELKKIARELVEVLPKAGGIQEGMYYDCLHTLCQAYEDGLRRAAEIADKFECDCDHPEDSDQYCNCNKSLKSLRNILLAEAIQEELE